MGGRGKNKQATRQDQVTRRKARVQKVKAVAIAGEPSSKNPRKRNQGKKREHDLGHLNSEFKFSWHFLVGGSIKTNQLGSEPNPQTGENRYSKGKHAKN